MQAEVLVIGAGVAGLTCARQLVDAGKNVLVLEKSRGVGGRCATRRINGSIVDHGLTFFHGNDEELRASLECVGQDDIVLGWPRRVRGTGAACQPSAFRAGDWRLAYANGLTGFPKRLARGLDIHLNSRVVRIEPASNRWLAVDEGGLEFKARDLVLTVPTPQALQMLDERQEMPRELQSMRSLLREVGFVSALTVIALYPEGGPVPDWEMWYPEDSAILQLISHDSSKRPQPVRTALVLQALPAWSRKRCDEPEAVWSEAMLEEVGRLAGSWATEPETVQAHRWRFARVGSGGDLSGPLMIEFREGRRLGFAGDGFSPGGGVQASWRSGRELARRLLEVQAT